jgi:AraC-like DNA-binding protein
MRLTKHDIQKLHEVKALITGDLKMHYTIDDLARKAGMNRDKLKVGFKRLFGVSPYECLVQSRMEMAKQLLVETDKPIKEIAFLTGYSYTSFITKIKEHFSCSPASMRNLL